MRTQLFQPCTVKHGDQMSRGLSLACGKCPEIIKVHVGTIKGHSHDIDLKAQQLAQRKVEANGWRIGGSNGAHRCPNCRRTEAAARVMQNAQRVFKPTNHTPPKAKTMDLLVFGKVVTKTVDEVAALAGMTVKELIADQPRAIRQAQIRLAAEQRQQEKPAMVAHGPAHSIVLKPVSGAVPQPKPMGRDDRRIIFEKLNEVYADEKTGYGGDWTDKTVAEDLGVPMAWVAAIREEMFGPAGGNSIISQEIAAAREVLAQGRKLLTDAADLKVQAEGLMQRANDIYAATAPLLNLVNRTERTIQEINRRVNP